MVSNHNTFDHTVRPVSTIENINTFSSSDLQIQVIDLLCFAVEQHTYRIKYYVLRKNVVGMALNLLKYREKHVQLAAIRFATT